MHRPTGQSHAAPALGVSDIEIYSNLAGQLTDGGLHNLDPAISGLNVVWQGWDGSDYEIYMGTYTPDTIPAPGAILLSALGVSLVGWLRKRRTL
jgi:hypothetical protein